VAGALAGIAVGGVLASSATVVTMLGGAPAGLGGAVLAQPAAWTVPVAFGVMVVVSLLTPSTIPAGVRRLMVRLHVPEGLDLDRRPDVDPRLPPER
jgi:Na+(H+)/acetate symporter ActP